MSLILGYIIPSCQPHRCTYTSLALNRLSKIFVCVCVCKEEKEAMNLRGNRGKRNIKEVGGRREWKENDVIII